MLDNVEKRICLSGVVSPGPALGRRQGRAKAALDSAQLGYDVPVAASVSRRNSFDFAVAQPAWQLSTACNTLNSRRRLLRPAFATFLTQSRKIFPARDQRDFSFLVGRCFARDSRQRVRIRPLSTWRQSLFA